MALDLGANFRISAGVSGQAQMDRFNASLRDANQAGGLLGSTMGSLQGVIAGLSVAAVGATLASMTRAAVDNADALSEMAERTGLAGDKLSELQYAAKMNGTELGEVEKALTRLSTKAFDAATGNKSAAATFDALGISVKGLDGALKSSDVLLQEVADVLNTVEDRTTRTALAVELFGKSGANLIPLLENMRDAREEAQRLGIVVGSDFQKSAAEFNDNIDRMAFLAKAFATGLANEVIPTLNRFMTELVAGREIFGSYLGALKNIGTTNPFNTAGENAEKYRKQAEGLEQQIKSLADGQNKWFGKDTPEAKAKIAELNGELENTKKLVEYFQRMNGQTSRAGAGRGVVNPEMIGGGNAGADLLERIRKANDKAGGGDKTPKESEFDRIKKQLQDQLIKVEELGTAEKLLKEIQLGRYKELTPEQQKELEAMARNVDYQRMIADGEKLAEERRLKAAKDRSAAAEKSAEEQKKEIERWKELADPAAKYRAEIERIKAAAAGGLISDEVRDKSIENLNGVIEKLGETKDKGKTAMKELKDAVEGWGKEATDAFVDFAFTGKATFSDMVTSMLKEMAKLIIQQQVMGPLFKALGNSLPSFFAFADGGVMTNDGPLPLRKYASGGIANSPQLALYGEAGPEAYVPLPDGRSIPVTMQGGGGGTTVVNVTVNAETGQTQSSGGTTKMGQLGNMIAGAVRQEIINQRRPGGLLAA